MKTTSKKRMLISSVAMLLVAMLSLGTATFAWFSTKTTADADGISVNSSKASGLLISEDNAAWSSVINYSNTDAAKHRASTLEPASSAFQSLTSPKFWFGIAADPTSYAVDTAGFSSVDYTNAAGYVNVYDLYAKSANGEAYDLKVSLDGALTDAGNYGRVAVVRLPNEDLGETEASMKIYYMAADETPVYPVKEDKSIDTAYPVATPVNNISDISLGTISSSTHFVIYVWNEGQDNDCKTTNANKALSFNLNLSLGDAVVVGP